MNELRTAARHALAWIFVIASVTSAWHAVHTTGPSRWWSVVSVALCAWSASWVERSKTFNGEEDENSN